MVEEKEYDRKKRFKLLKELLENADTEGKYTAKDSYDGVKIGKIVGRERDHIPREEFVVLSVLKDKLFRDEVAVRFYGFEDDLSIIKEALSKMEEEFDIKFKLFGKMTT